MVSALDNISRARARKSIASGEPYPNCYTDARSLISAIAKLAVFAGKTCTLGVALTGATTREPGSGLSGQMPPRPARCRGRASGASYAPVNFCGLGGTKRRGGARRRAPPRCHRPVHAGGRQLVRRRRVGRGHSLLWKRRPLVPLPKAAKTTQIKDHTNRKWAKGSLGLDHATQSLATICAYAWRTPRYFRFQI